MPVGSSRHAGNLAVTLEALSDSISSTVAAPASRKQKKTFETSCHAVEPNGWRCWGCRTASLPRPEISFGQRLHPLPRLYFELVG